MTIDEIFSELIPNHLKTAMVAGVTAQGSFFLSTHKTMDIKTLRILKKMIADHIKEIRKANEVKEIKI